MSLKLVCLGLCLQLKHHRLPGCQMAGSWSSGVVKGSRGSCPLGLDSDKNYYWIILPVAAGRGGRRGYAPRAALSRGGIWTNENMELWNLAASGELAFALQTVILYTPNTPLTLSQFWDHSQCSTTHTKQCVPYTRQLRLHRWSDWSFTCCKTIEDQCINCPVTVLLAIAIQCFALFTFPNSA